MDTWDAVFAELETQLRFDQLLEFDIEKRNRTTMQCQRLMPTRHVALAVPVTAQPRKGSDDPKGKFVVAFTDDGPWLFEASPSNPGLPKISVGPITDPAPITFAPHPREGGTLTFGDRAFVVPFVYAAKVRSLIVELSRLEPS